MSRFGFIIDLEKCYGCGACAQACRDTHLWPDDACFIQVVKIQIHPERQRLTVPLTCMHCDRPACREVCVHGALSTDARGVVQVDEATCVGCGACVTACLYSAMAQTACDGPRPNSFLTRSDRALLDTWRRRRARSIPTKCDLCRDRLAAGRSPACVAACPVGAFEFGEWDDLTRGARGRPEAAPAIYFDLGGGPRVGYRLPRGLGGAVFRRLLTAAVLHEK